MIHYRLRCRQGHEFSGWFNDSTAFDRQAAQGLVECPDCGETVVERALMAPAVVVGRAGRDEAPPSPAPKAPVAVSGNQMPAKLRRALQQLRAEVERRCDYVGPKFAEEARRIHHGESPSRGIYGETTPAEAEALADEGIEVARIPWLPPADG